MASGATVDNYASILGEDTRDGAGSSSSDEKPKYTAGFEDIAEVQDVLLDDSSASDNEIVRTNQLRLRPRQKRAHRKFGDISVLLRRKYQQNGGILKEKERRLEIQSDKLQNNLRQLLKEEGDGINWNGDPIKIPAPYYTLFYNRKKIEAFAAEDRPAEEKEEMRLVLDFIHKDEGLKTTLKRYDQCVPNGKITFDILWTIYVPNTIIIYNIDEILECYRCVNVSTIITKHTGEQCYILTAEGLDFDGTYRGSTTKNIELKGFQDAKDIHSLNVTPLEGHPKQKEITELMMTRYDRFQSLIEAGHSHKHGQGPAWTPVKKHKWAEAELKKGFQVCRVTSWCVAMAVAIQPVADEGTYLSSLTRISAQVNGRVVIDYKAYLDYNPDQCCVISARYHGPSDNEKPLPPMPESTKLLCPARMPGFSLRDRRWGWFLIDEPRLSEIEWKEDPFQHLEVEEQTKKLVQTLVKGHLKGGDVDFEDLVAGKGKGMTILLWGPPGLGKTLMAECLSEHVQRPLYRATAGELTIDVSKLEETLGRIFELGARWKALVLLDEADVLMSSRTMGNVQLNAVVAAFLRILEYYEGILFLTTNKPDDFDEAIRNRIQLEVAFDPISPAARRIIWKNMLDRVPGKDAREGLWTGELLDALSEVEMNGREIKNLLRLATCHASGEEVPLNPGHLVNVIRVKSSEPLEGLERWAGLP